MSTTETTLPPPTTQGSNLSASDHRWLLIVQQMAPLVLIDTTTGDESIALPDPGIDASSGQTGQNKEIIYKKISADSNTASITGGAEGTQTLTMQYAGIRFKSDGTDWWVVGVFVP
jgi:hypothetical protein